MSMEPSCKAIRRVGKPLDCGCVAVAILSGSGIRGSILSCQNPGLDNNRLARYATVGYLSVSTNHASKMTPSSLAYVADC